MDLGLEVENLEKLDPANTGRVGALEAANFLKKSKLNANILGKIWDLADEGAKGYLDKAGFFMALKLISLHQNGREIAISNALLDTPPPDMGETPAPAISMMMNSSTPWIIRPSEKTKYDQLFDSLSPVDNKIPGAKVKPIMVNSKLPVDLLGKIWELSDIDKDGFLDRHEFHIAMHLVYKALEGVKVPSSLPMELMNEKTAPGRPNRLPPGAVQVLPPTPSFSSVSNPVIPVSFSPPLSSSSSAITQPHLPTSVAPDLLSGLNAVPTSESAWVVTKEERERYSVLFKASDTDKDGFVSGQEIKGVFLQSGVPQNILAHIWNLCDMDEIGKLSEDQFALAMWLVNRQLTGTPPPATLSAEMIPPSCRSKSSDSSHLPEVTQYTNPELAMLSKEIEELASEKIQLESSVMEKEAELRSREMEIHALQGELETLSLTLKQLESQKEAAQKKLDDLDSQRTSVESSLSELKRQIEMENLQVMKLREQAETQEKSLLEQEKELKGKKAELDAVNEEGRRLEDTISSCKNQLEAITKEMTDIDVFLSQGRENIDTLETEKREMEEAVAAYDSVIEGNEDALSVPDTLLRDIPLPDSLNVTSHVNHAPSSPPSTTFSQQDDPFQTRDPFSQTNGFGDPFSGEDPFKGDPFAGSDPFASAFPTADTGRKDAFAMGGGSSFDPFGAHATPSEVDGGFGGDPFAPRTSENRGAPPPRPESPIPALPPKKSNPPPPRPAPPKHTAPPAKPPPPRQVVASKEDPFDSSDPFAPSKSGSSASDQFADFAGFDKFFDSGSGTGSGSDVWRVGFSTANDPWNATGGGSPWDKTRLSPLGASESESELAWNHASGKDKDRAKGKGKVKVKDKDRGLPSEDEQMAWALADSLRLAKQSPNPSFFS
ncbi:unnamed protein product [Darwinula stevensoni]|uniref:Epidermal growth factor receptor substrate 15-like 1 n=1 Tax=Darwinula stevensoni TaxID=69355 RepID=A0A7R8XF95_9CRUS|nr:unnamed protein product [Darwinula stevensoni]CAG0896062.1 unnamed protein product [Darwinula stevensoni]